MSAAHCTRQLYALGIHNFNVIVGEHDLTNNSDGTLHTVAFFYEHPLYNWTTDDYDFVMITLDEPVKLGDRVKYACLPTAEMDDAYLNGKTFTVSGWGDTLQGYPDVLLSSKVPYVPNAICQISYDLTETMLCAGNFEEGGVDACSGDSGGKFNSFCRCIYLLRN